MSRKNYLFTSESVSEGHPDKVCDQISDAIVDLYLGADPHSRVALETLATTNKVVLAGEVRGPSSIGPENLIETARQVIKDIGYEQAGFDWRKADIECYVHSQSADIAQGVDAAGNKDEGAGDQGIMFGYACRETEGYMPAPIYYAHQILFEMSRLRHSGELPELGPDAKSQVTLYYENGKPVRATSVVVSTQHGEDVEPGARARDRRQHRLRGSAQGLDVPEGRFLRQSDRTLRRRRPGWRRRPDRPQDHRGHLRRRGSPRRRRVFGQGPDEGGPLGRLRRALCRQERRRGGLADRCCLQLAYAIGVAKPLSIYADLYGTGKVEEDKLEAAIMEVIDLSPRGIRERLGLNRPIYRRTASYGHFGRAPDADGGFSWERVDLASALKEALS